MSAAGQGGATVAPAMGDGTLAAPLELPAESGKPLTTQGGNTLDSGSGADYMETQLTKYPGYNAYGAGTIPTDAESVNFDGTYFNIWDGIGQRQFRFYDYANGVARFTVDGSGNLTAGGHIIPNPTLPALPANPPVSGTVYQNTTGGPIQIALPVTGGSTADTAQWALGSTSTPGDWGGADTVAVAEVKTLHLTVPNNWYWSITTGATIGTADVLGS